MYQSTNAFERLNPVQKFFLLFLLFPFGPIAYGIYLYLKWSREKSAREAAEERRLSADRERRSAQRRREDARSECELLFSLYAPEIADRFPRSSLDDYMKQFMSDKEEPEQVESRGAQLRQVMQQHKDHSSPPERFASLSDLTTWFEEQKTQIESCPDERMRRSLMVQLKERYSELCGQLLEEI